MPTYRRINSFIPGDTNYCIRELPSVPNQEVLTDAWWTVKDNYTDADSLAEFSVHITPYTTVSGIGEITNNADGSVQLRFIALPIVSQFMTPNETFYFDVRVLSNVGNVYTLELGELFSEMSVFNGA